MNFYFFLGWKESIFLGYAKKNYNYYGENLGDGLCLGVETDKRVYGQVIWIRTKSDVYSLTHELIHAANHTLALRGVKTENGNDEALAYYVEYLMRLCK